jgi:hypothetical protein
VYIIFSANENTQHVFFLFRENLNFSQYPAVDVEAIEAAFI